MEEIGVQGIVFEDDSSFVSNRDRKSLDSRESVNLERCIAERETISITMGSERKILKGGQGNLCNIDKL